MLRLVGVAGGVVIAFLAGVVPAGAAETGVVLGDSEGVGVAQASGLKGLARISVHIRGPKAVQQINQAPAGATAFLVLGSNDAEGSIKALDASIDAIVQAAAARNIKLVWVGPPCVRRSWNGRVRELDQMLQRRFAGSSVKYVSMVDEKICSGVFQGGDGVHMTSKGYSYMWEKARTAAGLPATSAPAEHADEPAANAGHRTRVAAVHQPPRKRATHGGAPPAAAAQSAPSWDRHQN
jgi:hypothetical protein